MPIPLRLNPRDLQPLRPPILPIQASEPRHQGSRVSGRQASPHAQATGAPSSWPCSWKRGLESHFLVVDSVFLRFAPFHKIFLTINDQGKDALETLGTTLLLLARRDTEPSLLCAVGAPGRGRIISPSRSLLGDASKP